MLVEPLETEVIDEEQVRSKVAARDRLKAVIGAGLIEFAQEAARWKRTECPARVAAAPRAWARKVLPTPTGPMRRTCSFLANLGDIRDAGVVVTRGADLHRRHSGWGLISSSRTFLACAR